MSVNELVSPSQLCGLSYDTASLFGMPHVGCRYTREDVSATAWDGDSRLCAVCGRVGGSHSKHHEPPRSKGRFILRTPVGQFVLLPALIDLCGSGTTGCHGERHNGLLRIRWEWDTPEDERMWWSGEYLKRGWKPNGKWLFDHGCYVFERGGREKLFRDVSDAQWARWELR